MYDCECQVYSIRRGIEFDHTTNDGKKEIGTQTFRKNKLPLSEIELCFSLITFDRTYDFQCLNKADFDFLYYNLMGVKNFKKMG